VKTIWLLRHAKSSWPDDDTPDRERPLAPRGRRAAATIAAYLADHHVAPDLVLCSPALRARETLDLVRAALPATTAVEVEEELYGAPAATIVGRLRRLPDAVDGVLVVGHNPGLQELAATLAPAAHRDRLRDHFPTAALAILTLPSGGWPDLDRRPAELVDLVLPRERR
jgi:phosphohistidine phosphatase